MFGKSGDTNGRAVARVATSTQGTGGTTPTAPIDCPSLGGADPAFAAHHEDAPDPSQSDPSDQWRGHLVFDPAVSSLSPVVQGTWVTVDQVVSMIVDGESWAEILRNHPELTEDDIRACLAYAVEEDGGL